MSVNCAMCVIAIISAIVLRIILVRLNKKLEMGIYVEGAINAIPTEDQLSPHRSPILFLEGEASELLATELTSRHLLSRPPLMYYPWPSYVNDLPHHNACQKLHTYHELFSSKSPHFLSLGPLHMVEIATSIVARKTSPAKRKVGYGFISWYWSCSVLFTNAGNLILSTRNYAGQTAANLAIEMDG